MPYISFENDQMTAEKKNQLIEPLTKTAAEKPHISEQFFTVTINFNEMLNDEEGMANMRNLNENMSFNLKKSPTRSLSGASTASLTVTKPGGGY